MELWSLGPFASKPFPLNSANTTRRSCLRRCISTRGPTHGGGQMNHASRNCGVTRFVAGCFFFAIVCVCAAAQQIPQVPGDYLGETPYGSFDGRDIDSVNLTSGTLFIKAPFLGYPQRGKDLKLDFDILYNGKGLQKIKTCNPTCSESWGLDRSPRDPLSWKTQVHRSSKL